MPRCYEFFACNNTACKMYGVKEGAQCWETQGTLCQSHLIQSVVDSSNGDKSFLCNECIYKREICSQSDSDTD